MKNNLGITLVSLVVTIIILLILAGVGITVLIQTELFENAKEAKQITLNSIDEENDILTKYDNKIIGETTRENNQILSYKETILFDGKATSGEIIFLDNHNIDEFNRISTTDSRLIRRIVRDSNFRSYSAIHTLKMWDSVNRGEERNIFPYFR